MQTITVSWSDKEPDGSCVIRITAIVQKRENGVISFFYLTRSTLKNHVLKIDYVMQNFEYSHFNSVDLTLFFTFFPLFSFFITFRFEFQRLMY